MNTSIAQTIQNAHQQGAHRPFHKATMTKQPAKLIDPDTLQICDDPLPGCRAKKGRKYADLFKGLQHGKAVKCKPQQVGQISGALRKWIEDGHTTGLVRSMRDYGDGMGRVWLIADEAGAGK